MNASDVMVANVITIRPDAGVLDLADLLLANRISAVPVVDEDGRLLGIVSEGDLLRRAESGTERRRSWWLEALTPNESLAAEFVKAHGLKVGDVMTRNVVTAAPDTPIARIADLLERNRIKRVPIVKDGKILGIVSRANLLQALASARSTHPQVTAEDSALRSQVEARLRARPWTKPWLLNVIVHDGTVELWGVVQTETERDAARVAAEETPGVRAVSDKLVLRPVTPGS
jgi:CBS domain-containing protein